VLGLAGEGDEGEGHGRLGHIDGLGQSEEKDFPFMYFELMNFREQHKGIQIDLRQIQERDWGKRKRTFPFTIL
jgi:hypothetical protein